MIIRKATRQDARHITDILNEIIEIGGTTAYQTARGPKYFDQFITPATPKTFLHVAETNNPTGREIVGFQYVEPFDPPNDHKGGIATFAKPGTTQRGIGSALFEMTLKASRDAGYDTIVAVIRADNAGGLAYYTKMGFQDHSVHDAVPLTDGTPVDRIEKHLSL